MNVSSNKWYETATWKYEYYFLCAQESRAAKVDLTFKLCRLLKTHVNNVIKAKAKRFCKRETLHSCAWFHLSNYLTKVGIVFLSKQKSVLQRRYDVELGVGRGSLLEKESGIPAPWVFSYGLKHRVHTVN